jgi:mannan endo-1,4-beta-mannosidase
VRLGRRIIGVLIGGTVCSIVVGSAALASWYPVARHFGAVPQIVVGTGCGVEPDVTRYVGVITKGEPGGAAYESFQKATRVSPDLLPYFISFKQPFVGSVACQVVHRGALPLIQMNARNVSVAAIANGHYDSYLTSFGAALKKFHQKIVFSFGHEMNGRWYPWGYTHVPAKTFIRAWRHIHHEFVQAGAKNVVWLYTYNAVGPGVAQVSHYWPGKGYVNWVGLDGHYIAPTATFNTVFGATFKQIQKVTKDPVLISETAIRPGPQRPAQIRNLYSTVRKRKGMLGVVWFELKARYRWQLEGRPSAITAFRNATKGYFPAK